MRRLAKGCALRLASVLMGLLVAIALIEIALRLLVPSEISLLVDDEVLRHRYRRDFSQDRFIPESETVVHLRFHRDGFRGADIPLERAPGTLRIAVHGDSETAAMAVHEDQTMIRQLAQRLSASSRLEVEILNFGVSGYSTAQSLLAWRHVSRRYDPDLVILNFLVSNDLSDNCRCTSGARRPYFELDDDGELVLQPMSGRRRAASRWLTEHTRIYDWMKDRTQRTRATALAAVGEVRAGLYIMDREPSADFQKAWRITEEILVRFRDEVEAAGSRFLVVIAPYSGQYDDEVWQELEDALPDDVFRRFDPEFPSRALGEILRRQGIEYLDLLPGFKQKRGSGPLSFGRGHWNTEGNRLAAALIHQHLTGDGASLLPPPQQIE